jgi:hypothetical protein
MRISFGSIVAQPQNKEQVQTMSNIAYKTKETVEKRFGSDAPIIMKANITQDTAVFSTSGTNKAKENAADSIMQFYLRKTNIPFKQV